MSTYIDLWLDSVRLAEGKALEGLKAISARQVGENKRWGSQERTQAKWATILGPVENGDETAVEALCQALDGQGFNVTVEGGFIELVRWGEDGNGKTNDEGVFLAALGDLFEAGGSSWGKGVDDESWEYRFLGGSYELGWSPSSCWVSSEDQERVKAAWAEVERLAPGEHLGVLRQALCRAEFLLDETKVEVVTVGGAA